MAPLSTFPSSYLAARSRRHHHWPAVGPISTPETLLLECVLRVTAGVAAAGVRLRPPPEGAAIRLGLTHTGLGLYPGRGRGHLCHPEALAAGIEVGRRRTDPDPFHGARLIGAAEAGEVAGDRAIVLAVGGVPVGAATRVMDGGAEVEAVTGVGDERMARLVTLSCPSGPAAYN
jgi:hypothetical protein